MSPQKEIAVGLGTDTTTESASRNSAEDGDTKIKSILAAFLSGTSLNRFEAEGLHDHCLHSTVSSITAYGITISREWETVPCLRGRSRVRCKRYWLDNNPENVALARSLLIGRRSA